MTTYAIGDVRGNFEALFRLLEKVAFDPAQDTLWFTGNLVGGSDSLAVLRFVKGLGKGAVSVLGDQDLRLLAIAEGVQSPQAGDQFDELLAAPDKEDLLKWLRQRPFLYKDPIFTLVHAGIPAEWSPSQARTFAIEVESALSMGNRKAFLENIFADTPARWSAKHRGWNRLRFLVNGFTRMRYCDEDGYLDFTTDGSLGAVPENLLPWYRLPKRGTANQNIIFGHWMPPGENGMPGIFPLDTGCGLGGSLTAMQISSAPALISVES